MWDYPTSKSLWIRHALCVLWLLMRRFCFARNKRSMSTGESGSTLPDKLQHYGLYLEECFDVSNFQDAFPHSHHICLSLPHGIGVSRLVICCITPSGMLQVSSTMEGFLLPSTSIMDESGVRFWGRWQWWKVRFLKQRQRVSDHTAFLAAHPLIETLSCALQSKSWKCQWWCCKGRWTLLPPHKNIEDSQCNTYNTKEHIKLIHWTLWK